MSPEQQNNAPEWINEIKKLTGTTVDNVQNSPGWAQRFEKNLQAMGSKIEKQNKPLYSIVDGFPKLNHQPSDPMEEALQKAVLDARMSGDLNKAISLIQSANAPKDVQMQDSQRDVMSDSSSVYNSPLYQRQNAQPRSPSTSSSDGQKNLNDALGLAVGKINTALNWLNKSMIRADGPEMESLKIALRSTTTDRLAWVSVQLNKQQLQNLQNAGINIMPLSTQNVTLATLRSSLRA